MGAALDLKERQGIRSESISAPIKSLRKAAAGWGILAFRPVDPDYGVRRIYFGNSVKATGTWEAAKFLGAKITHETRDTLGPHWVNYYGPRDSFAAVSIAQALTPNGVPPDFFKDKIVLVGGQFAVGGPKVGRDEFATPYSRSNRQFTPGMEIHATILLNLLRGDWLTRMALTRETGLIVFIGLLAGALAFLRPFPATLLALLISSALACCCLPARLARTNLVCLVDSLSHPDPVRTGLEC